MRGIEVTSPMNIKSYKWTGRMCHNDKCENPAANNLEVGDHVIRLCDDCMKKAVKKMKKHLKYKKKTGCRPNGGYEDKKKG